jgi:hypothetical protein
MQNLALSERSDPKKLTENGLTGRCGHARGTLFGDPSSVQGPNDVVGENCGFDIASIRRNSYSLAYEFFSESCGHFQRFRRIKPTRLSFVNNLSRDQQILVIACLTEGQSIRSIEHLTGIHRDTIMRLGARVGRGCEELHDRIMVGVRAGRLELDEIWGYVGKKQKRVQRHEISHKGDQYTFIGMSASAKAIISYRTGKRDSENTDLFIQDLRERRDRRTRDQHRWLSSLQERYPGCLQWSRLAWRDRKDLQRNQPCRKRRCTPLQPGRSSSCKP